MQLIVAPSILSADFAELGKDVELVLKSGAEWIHIDVMDGHFVNNITIGAPVVKSLRKRIGKDAFFDCHLMIERPEAWVKDFATAGATQLTFHIEAMKSIHEAESLCKLIRELGCKASVSVKPGTDISSIQPLLEKGLLDNVLIMTVEPGFGGQSFMEDQMSKVTWVRKKYPTMNIQVDGGLNANTTRIAAAHGANVIVAGSAIFGASDVAGALRDIKEALAQNFSEVV